MRVSGRNPRIESFMANVALLGSQNVSRWLGRRRHAIVTLRTAPLTDHQSGMVISRRCPGCRLVADPAILTGHDVRNRLAGLDSAVVAGGTRLRQLVVAENRAAESIGLVANAAILRRRDVVCGFGCSGS